MKIELDNDRLTLTFGDRLELRSFFERTTADSGFLVHLPRELRFRQQVSVRSASGDGVEFDFGAEVGGISPGSSGDFATSMLLVGWDLESRRRLDRALALAARAQPETAAGSEPAEPAGETRGVSPMHKIRSMNPNQRTMLARKADRLERQILLNDSSPQVLQALLSNPRLEGKDVARLVKSTHTAAPVLKRIAEDGRWGQNQEILGLVARNPKTPSPLAVRLVDKLRTSDLRFMAKMSSGVRENIRRAALREYMRRTGQR